MPNLQNINFMEMFGFKVVMVLVGLVLIWFTMRLCFMFLKKASSKYSWVADYEPIMKNVARILIISVGGLIIMDSLGISITPVIASLGIGGLAIGLALQDTLANYFSGFYLLVEQPVKIGDFVKLESGEEGHVMSIGWRSTKIKMLANQTVIIPNKVFSSSRIINYDSPSKDIALSVGLNVNYNSDLENVEKVAMAVAKDIQKKVQGAVKDFEPSVRFNSFGESGVGMSVNLRAESFVDTYLIKHEFIKELHKKFRDAGITIPANVKMISLLGEKADQPKA